MKIGQEMAEIRTLIV